MTSSTFQRGKNKEAWQVSYRWHKSLPEASELAAAGEVALCFGDIALVEAAVLFLDGADDGCLLLQGEGLKLALPKDESLSGLLQT